MSPWRRGGDVAGRGAGVPAPECDINPGGGGGEGERPERRGRVNRRGRPDARDGDVSAGRWELRPESGRLAPGPQHEDPGGHRWGGGRRVGETSAPVGNQVGGEIPWGLKGSGSLSVPSCGDPPSTRDLLLLAVRAGVCTGPPIPGSGRSGSGCCELWFFPCLDPKTWALPDTRDHGGEAGFLPASLLTLHPGPGRVGCVGRYPQGLLFPGSAPHGPALDLHRDACPHRLRGDTMATRRRA